MMRLQWIHASHISWLAAAVLVVGCASLDSAVSAKGDGTANTYAVKYDVVWKAMLEAIGETELELVSQDPAQGIITARRTWSSDSPGESVAVFVEREDAALTRVEVVMKRRWALAVGAPKWEKILLKKLDQRL